ncbi:MAG: hypothetical protein ABI873_10800 [Marmoricola sp.]
MSACALRPDAVTTEEVADMMAFPAAITQGGHYLHWGVLSISLTNGLIIALMVLVFVLALFVPLGRHHEDTTGHRKQS